MLDSRSRNKYSPQQQQSKPLEPFQLLDPIFYKETARMQWGREKKIGKIVAKSPGRILKRSVLDALFIKEDGEPSDSRSISSASSTRLPRLDTTLPTSRSVTRKYTPKYELRKQPDDVSRCEAIEGSNTSYPFNSKPKQFAVEGRRGKS